MFPAPVNSLADHWAEGLRHELVDFNADGLPDVVRTGSDNHAVLTGTGPDGMLYTGAAAAAASACNDWTSKEASGRPWCGHSWPREGSGTNWISSSAVGGCAPCVGTGTACVGSTGGYGAFYCFVTNQP